MHEYRLAVFRPAFTRGLIRTSHVQIAVDEIGDDLNGTLDVEIMNRAVAKIVGNSSSAVSLSDRKTSDREITAVVANQSDVGSVQGGDEWQLFALRHHTSQ